MAQCSVLSCIAESGSEATLPEAVTVSDFRIWINASTANSTELAAMSFAKVCTVTKVGIPLTVCKM